MSISASVSRRQFEQVLTRLRSESDATIIDPTPELFELGCRFYIARPDKKWSLTDCISFIVMEREYMTDALTADRHFEQAGFRTLLRI